MSLRSHILSRGLISRLSPGDLLAAPRDPLLFLYPSWLSSNSRTSVAVGKRSRAPAPGTHGNVRTTRGGNRVSSTKAGARRQERLAISVRENKPLRGHSRLAASGNPNQNDLFPSHWTRPRSHGRSVEPQQRHYSVTTSVTNGARAVSQTLNTFHTESATQEAIAVDDCTMTNEQGKPLVRIVRASKGRQKHLAFKASVNMQLKDKGISSFDWRVPLSLLEQHTQPSQPRDDLGGKRILVHRDVIPALAETVGETLWDMKVRSGCEVHVLGEEEEIGVYRPVVLRGSPSSIEMAKEVISELFRQVSPDVRKPDGDALLFDGAAEEYKETEPSLVRKVWVEDRKLRQVRVDDIPRPEVWTTLSFADYVADLVHSTVSRSMQRHLYKDENPHVLMVRQRLLELFKNPEYDDIISVRAFNNALNFFYKHSMISTMRTLFIRIDLLRLRMLPETFNIMLRSAAAQKDLHHYTALLKLMIQRGHKPNASSWVALMMAVPSRAVQLRIESRMRELGLLRSPEAVTGITTLILPGELVGHLKSGQDMITFIGRVDRIYGQDWMSPMSLNRVLDVIGERGSFSQALDTIKLFRERGIRPNTISLKTLLSHCYLQGNLDEAVRLMQYIPLQFRVPFDEFTYHQLFLLAWKSRRYNVCRTVWRHACMAAAVSYKMQELMLRSLVRNTPSQPKTKGEMWNLSAAKVIAGVAIQPGTVAKLIGWSETGQQREKNLALAKEVLAKDLAAVLLHRPARSLMRDLTEAHALDRDWVHNQLWKGTSTIWKLEHAVNIALKPRSIS